MAIKKDTTKKPLRERLMGAGLELMLDSTMAQDPLLAKLPILALSIAACGDIDGGLYSGIYMVAGKSKSFKSTFGIIMMAAYLRDNPDAVAILYDSENGASIRYMQTYGVDMSRVFYERIDNVEDLRKKVITRLVDLDESDKVFFFVDSLGQLGSLKELNDTLTKDDLPSDMGIRAKSITSFFRIVTPILTRLKLPMYIINHYYESMGVKYPQKQIKGGQQAYLSSENIWIITSVKDKNTDNKIEGYTFNIYIEKSRKVKEGVTIPIEVKYNEDISEYSGLFEIAKRMGWIEMVSSGWYSRKLLDIETGELKLESKKQRKGEVEYDDSFWKPLLSNESFKQDVRETFTLHGKMMAENFAITEFEIVKPDL